MVCLSQRLCVVMRVDKSNCFHPRNALKEKKREKKKKEKKRKKRKREKEKKKERKKEKEKGQRDVRCHTGLRVQWAVSCRYAARTGTQANRAEQSRGCEVGFLWLTCNCCTCDEGQL